jgi:hypothetical protein
MTDALPTDEEIRDYVRERYDDDMADAVWRALTNVDGAVSPFTEDGEPQFTKHVRRSFQREMTNE